MKKIVFILLFMIFINVNAKVNVSLFYGEGCPYCKNFEEFAYKNSEKYDFNLIKYEVWSNKKNNDLLKKVASKFGDTDIGIPYIVIGNKRIIGWTSAKTKLFVDLINKQKEYEMCDIINDNSCTKDSGTNISIFKGTVFATYIKNYATIVLNLFG